MQSLGKVLLKYIAHCSVHMHLAKRVWHGRHVCQHACIASINHKLRTQTLTFQVQTSIEAACSHFCIDLIVHTMAPAVTVQEPKL